jgi:hypothetical protein
MSGLVRFLSPKCRSFFHHQSGPTPAFFSGLEEKFHGASQLCLALAYKAQYLPW